MFREIISWIGLLCSSKEPLEYLSKKPKDKKRQGGDDANSIFGYLRGLADESGHYDHLLQIVLNNLDFINIGTPARELLQSWMKKCSPSFTRCIIETFRQIYRLGHLDFYRWCLPFLCNYLMKEDETIRFAALSVLEEACYNELTISLLIDYAPIKMLLQRQCNFLREESFLRQQ